MAEKSLSRRRTLQLSGAAFVGTIAGCNTPEASNASTEAPKSSATDRVQQSDIQADSSSAAEQSIYTPVYNESIISTVLVQTDTGQGTGFLIDEEYIVTNQHVVGKVESVDIRFHDGSWETSRVAGTDVYSDLAVTRVSSVPADVAPLAFIDDEPAVGQEVVVIGNPFGLDGTATTGIVSGVNRSIPSPAGYSIPDAVQTDAAVNPGNSGGPIVSLGGNVVAVINSGGGENVAFGISAALASRVVPHLIESGSFDHPYMGVQFQSVTPAVAAANGLNEPHGILVADVLHGTPADGVLQPSPQMEFVDGQRVPVGGDIILTLNETPITTLEDLSSYLALNTRPGQTISVTVYRNESEQTLDLELGTRPAPQ
ncbi:S1C family serine protease [Haloferax volcanii]|uniref:S1C family serine protease n=1 Tax=Haloferax volcanii TaxID=2246 RepID=UPI0023DBAA41|nr:trypsin-like peptidase domain-containing protein [Haloferax lucentense]WEL27448.1 Serine protease Do [Haloferax lucentense]